MKCPNCGYEWEYGGEKTEGMYITCPGCYSKMKHPGE